jgi:hypothetical protein
VQKDYEELPAEAVPQLRDSLMQLLFKFGAGAPAVRTQLCLAIAALAAHLPAVQWGEGGVLRWLMDKFSSQDPAMAMSCMLELLTVLPQVCLVAALVQNSSNTGHAVLHRTAVHGVITAAAAGQRWNSGQQLCCLDCHQSSTHAARGASSVQQNSVQTVVVNGAQSDS